MDTNNASLVPDDDSPKSTRDRIFNIVRATRKHILSGIALIALVLSIITFVDVRDQVGSWQKSKAFEDSLEKEIKAFGRSSDVRILLLTRELSSLKNSLAKNISALKSFFDTSMVKFRQDLLNVQSSISGLYADVTKLQGSLDDVQQSMKVENSKVWAEFAKLEKEIKNLPKSGGHRCLKHIDLYLIIITIITVLSWETQ